MASALSAFVKTDKEVRDRLESMDSTLKSMYSAQLKFYKDEDKHRRRQEQAEKRKKADTKGPAAAFKKQEKEAKKGFWGLLGNLFKSILTNPMFLKFMAALGVAAVGIATFNQAMEDLRNGTVTWARSIRAQLDESFSKFNAKLGTWLDDLKVKWGKFTDDVANSRTGRAVRQGAKAAKAGTSELFTKLAQKFPGLTKQLDDFKLRLSKTTNALNKKGGFLDQIKKLKVGKGLKHAGKNLRRLVPALELLFAGNTFVDRKFNKKQSAGQALLGTGAETAGGIGGALAGGAAGGKLGMIIGSFIAPGIGTAIGGAIGGGAGAIFGGMFGQDFLGKIADDISPKMEGWMQDFIIKPFQNITNAIGDFWNNQVVKPITDGVTWITTSISNFWEKSIVAPITNGVKWLTESISNFWQKNVVEPFLNNPVVKWLTPIVESMIGFGKAFIEFEQALIGAIKRGIGKAVDAIGNEIQYWSGLVGDTISNEVQYWSGLVGDKISNEVEYWSGFIGGWISNELEYWGGLISNGWNQVWEGINKVVKNELEYWSSLANEQLDKLWSGVTKWWKDISGQFSDKWDEFVKVFDPIVNLFKDAKEVFQKVVDIIEDKLLGAFESIADFIQDKIIGFFGAGKNLLEQGAEWLNSLNRQTGGPVAYRATGGPINVPGTGSGDKVPMMLPENSFVMNRNAVHRQRGGLIPTLLEPGEQVYLPGQWNGMHMAMNSMFPRFQSGGQVTQNSHYATGSGWQPAGATDSHGRPIIFSKEAAQSFAKMMATGNVKGSDVASSKRSPAHNKTVGGVPNSAHLYGEAMDIHGTSKTWLISNSEKYGWVRNNYMPDSWHWDYKGGGSGGQEPPSGPAPMILAAGTNDYGQPVPAGKNVHDMIKVAKGKNYNVNFISPTASGKFAKVSQETSQQARVAGANTYMPVAWDTDGYHILPSEAANIKGKYPGATIIGDSNAARIEGTNGTPGRTKVGAQTSEIKGFIDGLGNGQANENGENGKLGNNAITPGNVARGALGLTGDVGEFFTTLVAGLGDIFGDIAGSILGGLANYGQNSNNSSGANNGSSPDAGGNATTASVSDPTARALLNAIAMAEGTTKSYGTMFGGKINSDLAAGNLTVAQAIQAGMVNPGSGATGRYQFMPDTLRGLVRNGSLRMDEKFTNQRQDEAALALVAGRGVNLSDGLSKAEVAKLAWEWASIKGNNYTYNGKAQGYVGQDKFLKWVEDGGGVIQRQSGGAVTAKPTSSRMAMQSQEQFLERMSQAASPVVVPIPIGGNEQAGAAQGGMGGAQTNVPDLASHPSGNIALDNAFRLSLGASFA